METLLPEFRVRCREAVLNLLWRQWCSLGVSGHAEPADSRRLIDLEALVLATTTLGRQDARLFDEGLDWLATFGPLINLQRLSNLQRVHSLGDARVLGAIAHWLMKMASQPRWKAIARRRNANAVDSTSERLFFEFAQPNPQLRDEIFLACGLERGVFRPRGMSRPPHPLFPPNLMCSLRALIGVSARVEILLYLAGSPTASKASEIAHATGYAPRTLQTLIHEMILSGHVLRQETPLRQNTSSVRRAQSRYQIQPADWAFLTSGKPLPLWTPWASIFSLIQCVLEIIPTSEDKPVHPAVVSSRLRQRLAAEGPALAAAGLLPLLDLHADASGAELLKTLSTRLPVLLDGF
jgi:hypothetical protein